MRPTTPTVVVALAAVATLTGAVDALAGAGSGTSSYGGGGGFSGGSYGGRTGGSGSGGDDSAVAGLVILGLFLLLVVVVVVGNIRYRRKRRARVRQVELAAAEAADDDRAFAPDAVLAAATGLFREAQEAWDRRDRVRLAELVGPELMVEWNRRLDDFDRKGWHNRVEVLEGPRIEYVGLVNRTGDDEDRVVVRIEAGMRDYVQDGNGQRITRKGQSEETALFEYWTLAKRGGRWTVESVEQLTEGDHHLDGEIVATPWGDRERLHGEAVAERAVAEAAPPEVSPAELADLDFDGEARAAALDLALADGRFDPALIEASVRRAVAAWAQAVDGDDEALEAVARPDAVREMLHPGDPAAATRLVVRGPRVRHVRIASLDAAADPPSIAVEVEVSGRRYIENRDTAAVVSGSRDAERTFTESWLLGLEGPADWPWRITRAGDLAPA